MKSQSLMRTWKASISAFSAVLISQLLASSVAHGAGLATNVSSTTAEMAAKATPTPSPQSQGTSATCTKLLLPSYWESFDTVDWNAVVNARSKLAPYAILNPHTGPGPDYEQPWADIRARLRGAGILAPAYIDAWDATLPLEDIYAQIDAYEAWYQPDGLYIDNAAQDASNVPYLRSIRDYMRAKMARPTKLVLNVGIYPDESYISVADILNLEATWADWRTRGAAPSWVMKYAKTRFSLQVVAATASQMSSLVTQANSRHIGYVYATDGSGTDWTSFAHVPSYWTQEVAQVRSTCP